MSTGYFYDGASELAPMFNSSASSSVTGPRMGSVLMKPHSEMWMDNTMTSSGSSNDLAFLAPMEPILLPAMDLHPLNFKKEQHAFFEPTSVLDMHLAPSPGSSPSRSSTYGSPQSSTRSTQSFSRQQSFSSNYPDSPLSNYSYPEDHGAPHAKVSLIQSNVGIAMSASWESCVVDPHSQGDIFDSLLDGEMSDTQTTSSHSKVQSESTGDAEDSHYSSQNMDVGEFESMRLLRDVDEGMLMDPVSQVLNDCPGVGRDIFPQMMGTRPIVKFDNFQPRTPFQHQSRSDPQSCRSSPGSQVEPCERFDDFPQQRLVEKPQPQEETGLFLVQLLLGCAEAVEKGNYELGRQMLSRLKGMASPSGDAMQRIAVYFGEALAEQINMITDTTYIHTTMASSLPKSTEAFSPSALDAHVAYQAYYQVLPYVKFAHFTANQAILEAVGNDERIHIVDLDIGQGLQWPSFIQSLSVRDLHKPCHLKITGVGTDRTALQQTGRRLCEFAASHHVPLEYHAVVESRLENLDAGVLRVHLGESLAVNCANVLHRLLGSHQQRALHGVLRMLNSLNPVVVAVVEVESNDNLPSFLSRFVEALHYYSALFDCVEATLGRSSIERSRVERTQFASNIKNILAHERSQEMVRHVRSESWQMLLRQEGFKESALSGYTLYQAKLLLGLYNGAYKLTAEGNALCLGWQDTPVVSVSAWTC